ncbi:MAG TPA: DUF4249 domain-containing protein [Flavobacteriales bacterium]|jgi:hypothetical protein|nr:DUF4249 domain-containing protein [Flavobacteriales bacterium]
MKRILFPLLASALVLSACEKEIEVDLPETPDRLVVEGTIEPGGPPIVILTRTQSYFDPADASTLASIFVKDATVNVTDVSTGTTITLDQICSDQLTEEQLRQAAAATGLDPALLAAADICIYSSFNSASNGVEGHTYALSAQAGAFNATAVSSIPHMVPLDSVWFKLAHARPDDDSLGYAWGHLTDPDTMGNAYRWYARRISHRENGEEEDPTFISPLGTTFNDKYINGLGFDFNAVRGRQFYSDNEEDNNEESGYFKVGDTIVVRFLSIGLKEYDFYTSYDNNVASAGDLFSTPANVRSNISGGLGVWCGRSVFQDTIICRP